MSRDLVRDLVAAARRSPFGRCEWCGHPCYGRACHADRDLTQLLHEQQSPPPDLAVAAGTGSDKEGA